MKNTFAIRYLVAGLVLSSHGPALSSPAEAPIASSGKNHVRLIELFSSESCSSCPPADAWISTLKTKQGLWKEFVPVVFHVDYWNQLGWKDGYSSNKMTQRQIELSKLWSHPSVYTPGFIVDGQEWADWRKGESSFPKSSPSSIELTIFKEANGTFRVKAMGLDSAKHYLVHLAELGMDLSTDVKAGENSGRLLKHNFIVLDWDSKPISTSTPEQTFSFKVDKARRANGAISAWIEEEGSPRPIQAAGGFY